jgi:hypothetical protein
MPGADVDNAMNWPLSNSDTRPRTGKIMNEATKTAKINSDCLNSAKE